MRLQLGDVRVRDTKSLKLCLQRGHLLVSHNERRIGITGLGFVAARLCVRLLPL